MTTPPPIESFEVPAVPQRFEALERIGPGGGGTVFKARDTRLRRVVALKFLDEADGTQDALAEARALATLSHPHVVSVYEVDTESHPPFIVMEFVAGVTLRSMIETSPLPMEQALRLAVQIASGLVAAHQAGLLHRDLSASNILVSEGERAKVVDFGLATGRRPQGAEAAIEPFPTAGTLGYMAPEQLTGRPLDHRTDIFSLGVILYEMITGRRPFGGATAAETARAALTEEPPPLGRSCPGIPLRLEAIVRRALEKDQGQRYATAQDMLLDLQALGAAGKPAGEFSIPPTVAPDANPGLGPPLPEWTGRWFSPRALLGRSRFRRRRTPVATQGAAIAFRGLLPFQEADRNRFFGREHETAALFDKVIHRDYRLGILFGESGCGKTSLLQAGLIPRLWEAGYVPIYCRAARRPDEAIIAECRRRSGVEPQPGDLTVDYLARSAQAGAGLVLILDQFEEFFASSPTVAEREPFLSLVAALEATPAPIKVLVAIRSDFLYLIGSELEQRVPDPLRTSRLFRLHDLDEERAASIIEATARRAALSWDGDLVRRVACDLAGGGAVRPSELQIVCERMQARRVHSIGEYVGAGGKEALVSEFLQDVVDGTGRRDDAARLLHCLVSDEGSRLALTAADIAGRTHSQPTAVARLLRVLVDARIVRETQDEEPWRYELIHDYLVERVQRMAGKRLDATERANRLFRQYLARHALDPRTRIPLREAWWVRRHSDLCRGVREEALLRKSLRAGSFRLASLVVLLLGASIGLAALLSVREEWDSVRFADGHTSAVRRVVFSPDGKLLASSGEDRRVIVWDFSRREPAAMLEGHGDQVTAIAFSPDGRWLASGSDDRSVVIWDTARLEKTRVLLGHRGRVRAVGFSPDGRFLVTSSEMPPAIVWRTDGWERLHDLPTRTGEQGTVAFFADGSVDPGIEARAWDLVTGKERAMRLDVKWTSQARSVSPDGSLLAWMDPDGVLAMANLGTGATARIAITRAQSSSRRTAAWSPLRPRTLCFGMSPPGSAWPDSSIPRSCGAWPSPPTAAGSSRPTGTAPSSFGTLPDRSGSPTWPNTAPPSEPWPSRPTAAGWLRQVRTAR